MHYLGWSTKVSQIWCCFCLVAAPTTIKHSQDLYWILCHLVIQGELACNVPSAPWTSWCSFAPLMGIINKYKITITFCQICFHNDFKKATACSLIVFFFIEGALIRQIWSLRVIGIKLNWSCGLLHLQQTSRE